MTVKGCQTPRIVWQPAEHRNIADEICDFYELWGRRLYSWQRNAIRVGSGVREDGTPSAFEVGVIVSRQNGKGKVAEPICLFALFVMGLDKTIYSAHRGDTVQDACESMKALIRMNPDLLRRCKPINDSDMHIELLTGQRLEFKTRSGKNAGRGLTCDLLIVDEALMMKQEQLNALLPTMTSKPFAQVWYTSTVPEFDEAHLCKLRTRALDHDESVAWAEWTADPELPLTDPDNIAQANPSLGRRVTLAKIFQLLATLGEDGWKTECMGIWPGKAGGAALDRRKVEQQRDPWSRRGEGMPMVFGIDTTPMLDWGTIGMWALRDDGLEHVQVVDSRPGVDWIVERAAELRAICRPMAWAVDDANGIMALVPDLERVGIRRPVDRVYDSRKDEIVEVERLPRWGELFVLNAAAAAAATHGFIEVFQRIGLRWPGREETDGGEQEPLRRAFLNVKTRPIGDRGSVAWGRRVSAVNIGPVVTVTQCRHVYQTWHDVISADEVEAAASIPLADGQCPSCEAWSIDGPITHYDDCELVRQEVTA